MKRTLYGILGGLAVLFAGVFSAHAQGVLVVTDARVIVPLPRPILIPRPTPPPASYQVRELSIRANIEDQIAKVNVSQTFVNTGSRQLEACFIFPLPYDGAIDQLTLMVNGKEFPAKLLPKEKAREIYESIVRKNQDPALLEWIGTGMFQTSVFPIPAGEERQVTLRYSQLLRKSDRLTEFLFPLATAKYTSKPVENLNVQVSIASGTSIKNVYSPTHALDIERPDGKHAVVKYSASNVVPSDDFRLFYDAKDGKVGASVISYRPDKDEDGYFVLLASPEIAAEKEMERANKNVVFVVDRSGSMSGKKIEQAKQALEFVLNNLRKGDTFNIVAYDSEVESFAPEMQKFDARDDAVGFVRGLYAGGSTNINAALTTALGMLKDDSRPNYIVFITDGLPTAGEQNEGKIVENAGGANKVHARMLSFGVGYDVNSRLLDRLARENFGQSGYARPDENIEAPIAKLYSKIDAPVMTDIAIQFDIDGAGTEAGKVINRLYPRKAYDLFAGEQLVLVGRYNKPGDAKVRITGKVGGDKQSFDFPAKLVEQSDDSSHTFVEKLWAVRRVGEIIDELDLKGQNDELIEELVELSTRHGILTPYTSFLADDTGTVELADISGNAEKAKKGLARLNEAEGKSGWSQRQAKNDLQYANQAPSASGGGFGGNAYRDIDKDELVVVESLRNVGNQALYKRGKQWVTNETSQIDLEKDKAKYQRVERYSAEYFTLVRDNNAADNQILATQQPDEELLVNFRGQNYLIW